MQTPVPQNKALKKWDGSRAPKGRGYGGPGVLPPEFLKI